MSIPYEVLEQILLRLDFDTLRNFCKQDTTGICDEDNEYFWKVKSRIDFGIDHKGPNFSFKDIYFGFKYNIRYNVMKYDAYIPDFGEDSPEDMDLPKDLSENEIRLITDELSMTLGTNCCISFDNKLLITKAAIDKDDASYKLHDTVIIFRHERVTVDEMNQYFDRIDNPEDYSIDDFIDSTYIITFELIH